jgi:hypothetical protein
MNAKLHLGIIAVAYTLWSGPALAQPTAEVTARSRLHAPFERMAEQNLKDLFLRCSRESSQRRLDSGDAARCSIASEVLKQRSFGGDFDALLAWWRIHRDDPIHKSSGEHEGFAPARSDR